MGKGVCYCIHLKSKILSRENEVRQARVLVTPRPGFKSQDGYGRCQVVGVHVPDVMMLVGCTNKC